MKEMTGCRPGNLNFFSLLNIPDKKKVSVIVDKEVKDSKWIQFKPFEDKYSAVIEYKTMKKEESESRVRFFGSKELKRQRELLSTEVHSPAPDGPT